MLFRVRHFFIPPFPTSLSRTFNRFKKEGRKITVNLYNSEIDKYSESPLLDPQTSVSNMSQKEKYSLLELLYFLADSSTFFRFVWHVHTETCHLKGIIANSWESLNEANTSSLPSKNTNRLVEVKASIYLHWSETNMHILYYIMFYYIMLYYVILYYVILYYVLLYYVILYYVILYYVLLYYVILYYIMLYYIKLYYIMLYYIMLYYIILCYIILYYVIWYYIVLWYIILCYIILCYIILYYVILYYIMLYYIILCYIILYYVILYYIIRLIRHNNVYDAGQQPEYQKHALAL